MAVHEECPFNVPEKVDKVQGEIDTIKKSLNKISDSLHTLLGRNNDIILKIVNGKTEERLASEVIVEQYYAQKEMTSTLAEIKKLLEDKKADNVIKRYGERALHAMNIITFATLILGVLAFIFKFKF